MTPRCKIHSLAPNSIVFVADGICTVGWIHSTENSVSEEIRLVANHYTKLTKFIAFVRSTNGIASNLLLAASGVELEFCYFSNFNFHSGSICLCYLDRKSTFPIDKKSPVLLLQSHDVSYILFYIFFIDIECCIFMAEFFRRDQLSSMEKCIQLVFQSCNPHCPSWPHWTDFTSHQDITVFLTQATYDCMNVNAGDLDRGKKTCFCICLSGFVTLFWYTPLGTILVVVFTCFWPSYRRYFGEISNRKSRSKDRSLMSTLVPVAQHSFCKSMNQITPWIIALPSSSPISEPRDPAIRARSSGVSEFPGSLHREPLIILDCSCLSSIIPEPVVGVVGAVVDNWPLLPVPPESPRVECPSCTRPAFSFLLLVPCKCPECNPVEIVMCCALAALDWEHSLSNNLDKSDSILWNVFSALINVSPPKPCVIWLKWVKLLWVFASSGLDPLGGGRGLVASGLRSLLNISAISDSICLVERERT